MLSYKRFLKFFAWVFTLKPYPEPLRRDPVVVVFGCHILPSASIIPGTAREAFPGDCLSVPDVSRERRCLQRSPEQLMATEDKKDKKSEFAKSTACASPDQLDLDSACVTLVVAQAELA